jgi:hypothetical protein
MTAPLEPTAGAATSGQAAMSAASRDEYSLIAARSHEPAQSEPTASAPTPEKTALSDALREEYGMLAMMLASVWSASLFRVSLFLGVVSAPAQSLASEAVATSAPTPRTSHGAEA